MKSKRSVHRLILSGMFILIGLLLLLGSVTTVQAQSANDGFDPNANGPVAPIAVQSDGKILIGGDFTQVGGQVRNRIARLYPDGSLDTTFNPGANDYVLALAVQADGKIVVGGGFDFLGGQARSYIGRLSSDTVALQDLVVNMNGTTITWLEAVPAPKRVMSRSSCPPIPSPIRHSPMGHASLAAGN